MTAIEMQAVGWLVRRLEWEDTLRALQHTAILAADADAGADVPPSAPSPDRGMSRGAVALKIRA